MGTKDGLALLASLSSDPRMPDHHRLYAVRGHLFEMADDAGNAFENYQAAAARTGSLPERNYLLTQAARVKG